MKPTIKDGIIVGSIKEAEDEADVGLNIGFFLVGLIGTCFTLCLLALPALIIWVLIAFRCKTTRARWSLGSLVAGILVTVCWWMIGIMAEIDAGTYGGIFG
jgi:hypothetical protein